MGAWPHIKPIFQAICAKSGTDPCCDWVGEGGSGHYVKMVHNGIEYGDMQLICEAYNLLKDCLGLSHDRMSEIFNEWNKGELDSFLMEISANIMAFKDTDGSPLVEKIRDSAGQKGTGKWTAISALDSGMPVTLIGESVFARCLSSLKNERIKASQVLKGPAETKYKGDPTEFIEAVRQALYASKIISYAQGFMLLRQAAKDFGWNLNYGGIALMWRGGCIIRSVFLGNIKEAYDKNPNLENLLMDDFFIIAKLPGGKLWQQPSNWVSLPLHFLPHLHFTMGIVRNVYLQTSFKHNGITLGLTRTSYYRILDNFITQIGQDMVETYPRRHTTPNAFMLFT